ncbi:MAG: Rpn family recombination-promoting nuclease/putative transposase [Desulfobacteraceae bacterium]|nr:Rpn family recombination-promoting nuclease/putative transposase [Desulfobacteraceae bacterium]MBC2720074.1 Rpn family recombination-promoting nuclease/putative transposase [Desulfobacteraceae bacterium]
MSDIINPHDRFFKEVLSRKEVARDFILHYLPADIVVLLDVDSLEIRKDSFVYKERGRNNFHNYATQLQIAFVRSQIPKILK